MKKIYATYINPDNSFPSVVHVSLEEFSLPLPFSVCHMTKFAEELPENGVPDENVARGLPTPETSNDVKLG